MIASTDYQSFLERKSQFGTQSGFEPSWLPDFLKDFQRSLVDWSVRQGRGAIIADCGLGKTPMQLVWAQNVVRQTNKPVLILTPLAVSHQTAREAEKFGIEAKVCRDGKHHGGIVVTNYERLHYFDRRDFAGCVCDESSILKNFDGATKAAVTEFMREMSYRLLCTATAAPNDFYELGTSSEALGYLGYQDMLTRFFKEDIQKDYLGWGRKKFRFRGHAENPFWRWVCSWARVCRKPSDLGFDDGEFTLPPLIEREIMTTTPLRPGFLFPVPAATIQEQHEERRISVTPRCEAAAKIAVEHDGASVLWCHRNEEGTLLAKLIPGAVEISGSMPEEKKEERLLAFQNGEIQRLVLKPKIGCFGLNWQHCHNVVTFASHSFEQYYQLVHRCLRFGQKFPVVVSSVTTEGEEGITKNLQRKSRQADKMFDRLAGFANEALRIDRGLKFPESEQVPSWL